jgi:hypothetical protein
MGDRDGATPEVRHGLCSRGQQHHANVALTGAYEFRLIVGNGLRRATFNWSRPADLVWIEPGAW